MKKKTIFTGMFIKTLLVICAVALVPTVLVGTIGIALFTDNTIARNYIHLDSITEGKVHALEYTIDEIQRHVFAISLNADAQNLLAASGHPAKGTENRRLHAAVGLYLKDILANSGGLFDNLRYFDRSGQSVAEALNSEKISADKDAYFILALEGRPHVSGLYYQNESNRPLMIVSVPVYHENKIIGIFAASVDFLKFVEPLISEYNSRGIMQYAISDGNGLIIAATNKDTIGTNPAGVQTESASLLEYMKQNPAGTNRAFDNSQVCFAFAKLHQQDWYFITAESTKEVLRSVDEFRLFISVLLSLLGVLVFFLALAYSSSLTREARATVTALFESTPQPAFIFNADGKMADCNPAALAFYGVKSAEELFERYAGFWPDRQHNGTSSAEFLKQKFEETLLNGHTYFECTQRIKSKTVYLNVILKKIYYNNSQAIAFYQFDLTEHREAERALLQKDHLLEAVNHIGSRLLLVNSLNDSNATYDALKIFGEAKDVQGMRLYRHYQDENGSWCGKLFESWEKSEKFRIDERFATIEYEQVFPSSYTELMEGKKINGPVKTLPGEGKAFFSEIKGIKSILLSPILLQNEPWGFIIAFDFHAEHIFTEAGENALETTGVLLASSFLRNRANADLVQAKEAALSSTRAKSEFLSRMSHEIRTPLNAVIGMTRIAQGARNPEKISYYLGKIDDASHQLLSIINDVLDMSKIEADKFELSEAEFNFEKTIEHLCNVIAVKSEEKHQSIIVNIGLDIPLLLVGDEIRLSQVLTNLLFNAIKFTPENGVIKIGVKSASTDGQYITLSFSVADNGIGITPEQKQRLFNSFEQADGSISRKFGGTGLGLSICKKIVALMGGEITVESEFGKGSTFTFTARFTVSQNNTEKKDGRIKVKSLKVLAVDDSSDIREYFTQIMQEFRIECDTAKDGSEALELCEKKAANGGRYDLVFLDWKMPGLDGIQTAQKLHELIDANTVIIMISVAEWSDIREQAEKAGIKRFVQKPLFPSSLLNAIYASFNIENGDEKMPAATDALDFSGCRILLAEDVEINREIFISLVEDTGVVTDSAQNGREAIEKFAANPEKYDLILMDIHMPETDGYAATKAIRGLALPQAKTIPIIAMTANAFREDVEKCLECGMNDHIAKPLEPEIVFEKLRTYLPQKKPASATDAPRPEAAALSPADYKKYEPDLNIAEGIRRLGGKEKVYFSLLKGFKGKELVKELEEKAARQNTEELKTFLHTIKGILANLSLQKAADIARQFENRLKAGADVTDFSPLAAAILHADTLIHDDLRL